MCHSVFKLTSQRENLNCTFIFSLFRGRVICFQQVVQPFSPSLFTPLPLPCPLNYYLSLSLAHIHTQTLDQWFPTGVPWHTRVPWKGVGVPPNIKFTTFLSFFTTKGAQNCHFNQVRVPPNFFLVLQGAVNQKRLKNTALAQKNVQNKF